MSESRYKINGSKNKKRQKGKSYSKLKSRLIEIMSEYVIDELSCLFIIKI